MPGVTDAGTVLLIFGVVMLGLLAFAAGLLALKAVLVLLKDSVWWLFFRPADPNENALNAR